MKKIILLLILTFGFIKASDYALSFDGSNDRVSIAHNQDFVLRILHLR